MRPRFGALTRVCAAVFAVAGWGAGYAGLASGHQSTPGHSFDTPMLFGLAVGFLGIGLALAFEQLWAWWAALAVSVLTVVLDPVLQATDWGWLPWLLPVVLLCIAGVQGVRDRSTASSLRPPARP
jgi:hypothetical protein